MTKKKQELSSEEQLKQALVPLDEQPYQIPENWIWVRLYSVISEIKNGTTIKQDKSNNGYSVTRIESLQNNTIDFNRLGTIIDETKIRQGDWYKANDIALSHINSAEHVGKTALIETNMLPLVHGMNLLRLTFNKMYSPKLFQFYSQSYQYKDSVIKRINRAVNQVSINQKQLGSIELAIPPLAEQQRIISRIESLFEKLDRAKELIQDALDTFENRKAAILHKAFAGELTKRWREENGVGIESWEENKLSEICTINPKRINTKELDDNLLVSFIPMPAVSDVLGEIISPQVRTFEEVKKGYTNFSEEDIIFAKITPCMENGKCAVVGKLVNDIGFGSTEFHVLRCSENAYNRFLYHLLRSQFFRDEAKSVMTGAVGQQRVPKKFLEDYSLKLPKYCEQIEIIELIDSMFEKEEKAKELFNLIDNLNLMKKSILARAFRGELGTNNLDDENVLVLLKAVLE
ncbi:restriction endonuclease subunit S [Alkalibacter mobilis]|uniref:restriction endonuclease subunit S n=1 Tax=Alkalibacter mobilis TaxID=2787712 RepID=UPI0018A0E1F9|nr:restriction endonuclease subunit S [Alkalibacter mobilis]MBF7097802.1 restriction endonuclease subunit S [Alkalibacter mobilis]